MLFCRTCPETSLNYKIGATNGSLSVTLASPCYTTNGTPPSATNNVNNNNGSHTPEVINKSNIRRDIRFKYRLQKCGDVQATNHMDSLEKYVMFENLLSTIRYNVRLPEKGKYQLNMYGLDKTKLYYDLVCSYLLNCDKANPIKEPYPDAPSIGWSPHCAEAVCMGITPVKYTEKEITIQKGKEYIR